MATTTAHQEKQKKLGFFNFYKFTTRNYKSNKSEPANNVVTNKIVSSKKSNGFQEIAHAVPARSIEGERRDGCGEREGGKLVEGRKSVSHVETNLESVASFLHVKVLVSDMPGFMQVHAFRCARRTFECLDNFSPKRMAYNLKKEFDKVYGPAWHCIVGTNFGSFVTHSTGCFLYFSMENLYILVFKTKVQKVLDFNK